VHSLRRIDKSDQQIYTVSDLDVTAKAVTESEADLQYKEVLEASRAVASGEAQAIGRLRRLLVDLDVPRIAPGLDSRRLGSLVVLRQLVNMLWANLATDARFPVPEEDARQVVQRLARFVVLVDEGDDSGGVRELFDGTETLYQTIAKVNEIGRIPWTYKGKSPPSTSTGGR